MRPTIDELASRRPALSALSGALPREGHFGLESTFGGEFGFGLDDEMASEFGYDFNPNYTNAGQGMFAAAQMGDPSFADAQIARGDTGQIAVNADAFRQVVGQDVHRGRELASYRHLHQLRSARTAEHAMLLDPNADQRLKLGRYSFGLSQAVTIGVPAGLFMSDSPATTLRTKRVVMNAPTVGFATVSTLLIANVAVTVGGVEDAYAYGAGAFDVGVDYPTLPPSQKATMSGSYTGFAPAPLFNGQPFVFSVRFSGISTIAGGA